MSVLTARIKTEKKWRLPIVRKMINSWTMKMSKASWASKASKASKAKNRRKNLRKRKIKLPKRVRAMTTKPKSMTITHNSKMKTIMND